MYGQKCMASRFMGGYTALICIYSPSEPTNLPVTIIPGPIRQLLSGEKLM